MQLNVERILDGEPLNKFKLMKLENFGLPLTDDQCDFYWPTQEQLEALVQVEPLRLRAVKTKSFHS